MACLKKNKVVYKIFKHKWIEMHAFFFTLRQILKRHRWVVTHANAKYFIRLKRRENKTRKMSTWHGINGIQ